MYFFVYCVFIFKDVLHGAGVAYHKPLAKSLDAAIKQAFPDQKQSQVKIIDAGAGTGLAGVELSKLGYTKIDAIDISQEMLNEAKKTKAYTKLICAPLNEQRNPEIETGEYHGLICTGTLMPAHIRPKALEEMMRMVKSGKDERVSLNVARKNKFLEKGEGGDVFCTT